MSDAVHIVVDPTPSCVPVTADEKPLSHEVGAAGENRYVFWYW
jgi:hypothetical protein